MEYRFVQIYRRALCDGGETVFENVRISVENITADGCDITFNQAGGKDRPDSYDIYILSGDGLVKSIST